MGRDLSRAADEHHFIPCLCGWDILWPLCFSLGRKRKAVSTGQQEKEKEMLEISAYAR